MGRAIDRLPLDFAEPRVQPRKQSRAADVHSDNDHTLTVPFRTPEQHAERRAAARANLDLHGASDLADMLGLTDPPPAAATAAKPARPGPLSVPCPQCLEAVGHRCRSVNGIRVGKSHRSRCRRAEAVRAGRQTEELTKESA